MLEDTAAGGQAGGAWSGFMGAAAERLSEAGGHNYLSTDLQR